MTFMSNCSCGGKGCGNCGGGDYEYRSPSGDLIESLRSRAEKAEAERDTHKKASEKWYQSYQFKEATCEKLAKALETFSQAARVIRTVGRVQHRDFKHGDPFQSGIAWKQDGIVKTVTYGDFYRANEVLAAYRKEASE